MLRWALEQYPPCYMDYVMSCTAAAEGGHLEVLKWAVEQGCLMCESVCLAAARFNHLAVLKWARAQDNPCPWNADTCLAAAQHGHLVRRCRLTVSNPEFKAR